MVTDPMLGRLVDSRYEIVARVARGGMATVYAARDRRLDRSVALKLMHQHLADSPNFVARFRREARAAARLSNPGVVAVYDQGSLDGVAYIVMELVEGPNLRDLIAAGPLSVKEALELTAQILRPLGAAHRAGLVHRDVKPENVLLPEDGSEAKVADFGLARAVTEATQTTAGNVLGTVAYLAPELITSGTSGPRADVYSTGVILFELLTGEQPFTADSPIQIAFRNVHEDIPRPSTLVESIPGAVDTLVATMTCRSPEGRPANADEALTLLRQTVEALSPAELSVRRGGGNGSERTQEALATNAAAARHGLHSKDEEPSPPEAPPASGAGLRTVSLPIGSIAPTGTPETMTRALPRHPLVHRSSQETVNLQTRPGRRIARRALLGGTLAALLTSGGLGLWYVTAGGGRLVTVPDVVGLSAQEAKEQIESTGLAWGHATDAYSDTVPAGSVISTEPEAPNRLRTGGTVTAVISLGVEQKIVPDVAGMTLDEAREAITTADLKVGEVSRDYSAEVDEGRVVSSDPAAGTSIDHSSVVALTISLGRRPTVVPDVLGKSLQAATTTLEDSGLVVGTTREVFSDSAAGTVISSSPRAHSPALEGDAVSLELSKGPEMVTVPDTSGRSKDDAVKALEDAGLKVTVETIFGGTFGLAQYTDPAAGSSVKKGSTITLYIL